jgi:hypothetical protein
MRLPRLFFERAGVPWPALVLIGAAVPPAALHAALDAAAGTLLEAAPFVLTAEVLPRRFAAALESGGCGCGRRIAGALSLPAAALCWFAFGPWIALARFAAGLALLRARRGKSDGAAEAAVMPDAFAELRGLVLPAMAASLLAQALGAHATRLQGTWQPLVVCAGACLGAFVPCATAGVALAAGLAPTLPAAAGGILATAGFVTWRAAFIPGRHAGVPGRARLASVALGLALAALVWRGPSGLVNPRLLPLDALGAAVALAGAARRRTSLRGAPLLGAGLACAMLGGSAIPPGVASETTLAGAYPGQRITFTGIANDAGGRTTVQRFAIACCRLDATPVAARLTRRLAGTDGRWIALQGSLVRDGSALLVRPERWQFVPAPADPFVYR